MLFQHGVIADVSFADVSLLWFFIHISNLPICCQVSSCLLFLLNLFFPGCFLLLITYLPFLFLSCLLSISSILSCVVFLSIPSSSFLYFLTFYHFSFSFSSFNSFLFSSFPLASFPSLPFPSSPLLFSLLFSFFYSLILHHQTRWLRISISGILDPDMINMSISFTKYQGTQMKEGRRTVDNSIELRRQLLKKRAIREIRNGTK